MLGLTIARCSRADLEPDPYKTTEPAKPNLYPGDAYQKGYFSQLFIFKIYKIYYGKNNNSKSIIHLYFQ